MRAICELKVRDDQTHLVAPAAYTIAEGNYEPNPFLRAIYSEDEPVGVLFVALDEEVPFLVRYMVDADHQGKGIGEQAFRLLTEELRRLGHDTLEVSFVPAEGGAEGFWRRCGFIDTGRAREGEVVLVRSLSADPLAP